MRIRFPAVLPFIALTGCSPAGNDTGPGGVTVDEARALDEAAQMLDSRRLPDETGAEETGSEEPGTANDAEPS